PCPAITVSGSVLEGTVGQPYGAGLSASGGSGPYVFTVSGGSLPPGLALDVDGSLSGPPPGTRSFSFDVTATDANGCAGSQSFNVTVASAPCPTITVSGSFLDGT